MMYVCVNALLGLLLVSCHCFHGHSDIYPTLAELCPSRTFCQTNATKMIQSTQYESCCQACSCEDSCLMHGNCCPDFEPVASNTEDLPTVTPCVTKHSILNDGRIQNVIRSWKFTYRFVTTCPTSGDVNDEIVQLCKQTRRLNDYIPVSTLNGNRLYRNEHCARCNGESDFVFWNLYVDSCPELYAEELTDIEARDRVILEKCVLTAQPTSYRHVQSTVCPIDTVVGTCNFTGLWDRYDEDIERACVADTSRTNSMFRYRVNPLFTNNYANVYCFLCNEIVDMNREDVCATLAVEARLPEMKPFTVLIDHIDNDFTTPLPDVRCPASGTMFDPYMQVCRQLICGMGMMPSLGVCRSVGQTSGIPLSLRFGVSNVTDIPGNQWLLLDGRAALETFYEWSNSGVIMSNWEVNRCITSLHITDDGDEGVFYFSITFVTTHKCELQTLFEHIKAIADKSYVLKMSTPGVGERNLTIHLDIESEQYDNNNSFRQPIAAKYDQRHCSTRVLHTRREMLETCPRLRLTEAELRESKRLSNELESISALVAGRIGPNTITNTATAFTICVSTYTTIMQSFLPSAANGLSDSVFLVVAFTFGALMVPRI